VFRSYFARLRRSFRYGKRSGSEWTARNGLPQGCSAAPDLLNMVIVVFHTWARRQNVGVAVAGEVVSVISFADDVAVVASSPEELQVLMRGFLKFCRLAGFEVSIAKTQVWANRAAGPEMMDVDGVAVSVSPTFKMVGIISEKTTGRRTRCISPQESSGREQRQTASSRWLLRCTWRWRCGGRVCYPS